MPTSASLRRLLAVALTLVAPAAIRANAQATSTMYRQHEISVFGGFSSPMTDYTDSRGSGYIAGADFSRYLGHRFIQSLEIRGTHFADTSVTQRAVMFGPRISRTFGSRWHPYAAFFVGGGTMIFANNWAGYHEDRSKVYAGGGGLNVDLTPAVRAKIDYQQQFWNIGKISNTQDVTFSPTALTLGVEYRIPFKPRVQRVR